MRASVLTPHVAFNPFLSFKATADESQATEGE